MTSSSGESDNGPNTALEAEYERAGFGAALPFGKRPALLLIDIVRAYLVPDSTLYAPAFEAALLSAARLATAARAVGVPVIFTNVVYQADGLDGGVFFRKVPALKAFLAGSELGAFDRRLQPERNELVVSKQYASAFFGTSLAATLTAMGCDTVMIAGFSTSGCVRASALDAMQHGFVPYVVGAACGDRDRQPHDANLFDLQAKYAEVVDEARALGLLQRAALRRHSGPRSEGLDATTQQRVGGVHGLLRALRCALFPSFSSGMRAATGDGRRHAADQS